ncbi:hypothetical protein [Roseibium sp.]|uniref:hypothetical protein n=1 Tax=Roseibium sp. TaxID=1936156 RepID=UPI003B5019EF
MSRIEESDDDTRGLGDALLAFARAVHQLAPDCLDPAIAAAYDALDAEKAKRPNADLRLGYEFLELAEVQGTSLGSPQPKLQ